jgi:hypothetical protein
MENAVKLMRELEAYKRANNYKLLGRALQEYCHHNKLACDISVHTIIINGIEMGKIDKMYGKVIARLRLDIESEYRAAICALSEISEMGRKLGHALKKEKTGLEFKP